MTPARAAEESDRRVVQLRRLSDIGRAYTYTTSLDEVARLTVERGAALLDSRAAVLMVQDSDGLMHVRAAHGVEEDRLAELSGPLSGEVYGRLQGLLGVPDDFFIAVPLVVGGAVSGLLAVALPRASTDADEWLLSALADQAAVALENARLGGEVRLEMEGRLRVSEGATSAKDRALATLAHDIRTPIGAIRGYCELLEEEVYGPINQKQREAVGRVRMSGLHLLSLLENVMDMARLTAGVAVVRTEPVRLADVARDAVDMLAPAAAAKFQRLEMGKESELVVAGDEARLRQVLVNLLGNAVKFTPTDGSITVLTGGCTVGEAEWGEIRVSDTGPGIAEQERSKIFEAYYRTEDAAPTPGIGLGLAISHALIEKMGGTLVVESTVGEGSTFSVRLPLAGGKGMAQG